MANRRKDLIKEADEILGVTRGPGRPSKAAKELRLLSEQAADMVLDGDKRPLEIILQSLQSDAEEAKEEEMGGALKAKTKPADRDVFEETQAELHGGKRGGEGGAGRGGKHTVVKDETKKKEACTTGRGGGEDDLCTGKERGPRPRKQTIFVKVQGDASMDPGNVLTKVGQLVRDEGISRRRGEVVQKGEKHSYYLRPRRPTVQDTPDEVDHTFECQMLAHAIFQTPDYHPILKQMDINTSSHSFKDQPNVVEGALSKLKDIQNCVNDPTLFNLKMLNKSLNSTKGAVIRKWLSDRATSSYSHLNYLDLRTAYRKSAAVLQHEIIDTDEADELAKILANDLIVTENTYLERLDAAAEMVDGSSARITDKRVQKKRLVGLKDAITQLQEEHSDC